MPLDELCDLIRSARRPQGVGSRIVGVDGLGGSGKSTFVARLGLHLGGVPILRTDYFASWDEPLAWYPRLLSEALTPLAQGREARFRCYDWERRALGPWIRIPPAPIVVLEGVSATRRSFAPFLAFRVWIDTARELRLARGVARDGEGMRVQWEAWMRDEDEYVLSEDPERSADLVVAGDPHIPYDPEHEVVVRRSPS
jgi:uridine kinase